MTKTVFKFVYTAGVKVILSILLALFGICAVKNLLTIFQAFGWHSSVLWLDIAGLILSVFLIVFIILIFTYSRYVVTNSSLYVRIGMVFQKIPCGLISTVVKIPQDGAIFILYTSQSAKPSQLKINIVEEDLDKFISALKALNPEIMYEIYHTEDQA